jgi:hypothetical protein
MGFRHKIEASVQNSKSPTNLLLPLRKMYVDDAHDIAYFKIAIYSETAKAYILEPKERFIRIDAEKRPIPASAHEVVDDVLEAWDVETWEYVFLEHPRYYETHKFTMGCGPCAIHIWKV